MGFEAWIDDQFTRPVGLHPAVGGVGGGAAQRPAQIYTATGSRTPGGAARWALPKLRPDARPGTQSARSAAAARGLRAEPDLRHLGPPGGPRRRAGGHGELLRPAGRSTPSATTATCSSTWRLHPCMGIYLSHLGNRKADPAANIFPGRKLRARDHAALQHRPVGAEPGRHAASSIGRSGPADPDLRQRRHHRIRARLHRPRLWRQRELRGSTRATSPCR